MTLFPKRKKFLTWLDNNILLLIAGFLLAFIPLYPKIPLFSPIEQYIVRVRVEDIFILVATIIWAVQVRRKKVAWKTPILWLMGTYLVVGLLSLLNALFLIKTIPLEPLHVGKSVLHYLRYIEYFTLFVIFFSAIKKRKDVLVILTIFTVTITTISAYGYAQKYFYWPVYSTMNREFSKGIRLVLTEHARVQSTFAGHYDMGAYLVITLPIILALFFLVKEKKWKLPLLISFFLGTWLIILSASRTPFAAYLVGVGLTIFTLSLLKSKWREKVSFLLKKSLYVFVSIFIIFYYFGGDMAERLGHVITSNPTLEANLSVLVDNPLSNTLSRSVSFLPSPQELQDFLPKGAPPNNSVSTEELAASLTDGQDVVSLSDIPPVPFVEQLSEEQVDEAAQLVDRPLPRGVYRDVPETIVETEVTEEGEIITQEVTRKRIYSECALEKELSLCIRLETLWPQAIQGFVNYPLLGSGYATLTKQSINQFTEADSTDNNFLRTLGETGILGFISFYGIIFVLLYYTAHNIIHPDYLTRALSIGIFAGIIGLLLNAIYIDVFVSSKVAETFWAMTGAYLGFLSLKTTKVKRRKRRPRRRR